MKVQIEAMQTTNHWEIDFSPSRRRAHRIATLVLLTSICCCWSNAYAFRVKDATDDGFGIARWNAAPHYVDGVERSLDGGLRYSLQGGSYEAYMDQLRWSNKPSVAEFQAAVEQAFNDWTVVDFESGLGSDLYFVPDFETTAFFEPGDDPVKLNRGAEIDLLVGPPYNPFWEMETSGMVDPIANTVTLTSGVENYPAVVFSGSDIIANERTVYVDVAHFQNLLSHAIGWVLGLGEVDSNTTDPNSNPYLTEYYDDNFDDTNDATALATLTNSFAELIDSYDPDHSAGLMLYEPCADDNGCGVFDIQGVNINMESDPKENRIGPQNDDFAGRQFLYPFVRVAGDFNADKVLTVEDVDLLLAEIRESVPRHWFDLSADGTLDIDDLMTWVHELNNTWIGDANLDGEFNSSDLVGVLSAGTYEIDVDAGWASGDFDGSGRFDSSDLVVALADGGYEQGPRPAAVPEPPAFATLIVGLIAALSVSRTRQRPF